MSEDKEKSSATDSAKKEELKELLQRVDKEQCPDPKSKESWQDGVTEGPGTFTERPC